MRKKNNCPDCDGKKDIRCNRCKSCAAVERWKDIKYREKQSNSMSIGAKKRFEDLGEIEKASERARKQFRNLKEREKTSIGVKKYFEDPNERENASKRMIGNKNALGKHWKRSNKAKEKDREATLKRIQNNPGLYKDTKPELKLKEIFNRLNISFEHQVRVKGINHIWDFRKKRTKTLIEVDGRYFHTLLGARQKDYRFNRLARKEGYTVFRFWDDDIMKHEDKVIEKLKEKVLE